MGGRPTKHDGRRCAGTTTRPPLSRGRACNSMNRRLRNKCCR
jgi:hypothetical protein